MLFEKFNQDLNLVTKQRNFFLGLTIGLIVIICLLMSYLLGQEKKIVVIPAGFNKEIHLSDRNITTSYLEEMSHFFANNLLDLTPDNFPYRKQIILKYVAPKSIQALNKQLNEEELRYKEYNLKTSFVPTEFVVHQKQLLVIVSGILTSHFGQSGQKIENIKFAIKYQNNNGILLLEKFGITEQEELQ